MRDGRECFSNERRARRAEGWLGLVWCVTPLGVVVDVEESVVLDIIVVFNFPPLSVLFSCWGVKGDVNYRELFGYAYRCDKCGRECFSSERGARRA